MVAIVMRTIWLIRNSVQWKFSIYFIYNIIFKARNISVMSHEKTLGSREICASIPNQANPFTLADYKQDSTLLIWKEDSYHITLHTSVKVITAVGLWKGRRKEPEGECARRDVVLVGDTNEQPQICVLVTWYLPHYSISGTS